VLLAAAPEEKVPKPQYGQIGPSFQSNSLEVTGLIFNLTGKSSSQLLATVYFGHANVWLNSSKLI
jgi:hypothetical protein